MNKSIGYFATFLCFTLLTACTKEPVYRGVPSKVWNQLNSEQKLLIIDKSMNDELYNRAQRETS